MASMSKHLPDPATSLAPIPTPPDRQDGPPPPAVPLAAETATRSSPQPSLELGAVQRAIGRAQEVLWHGQGDSGAWSGTSDFGPWSTAQIILCLHYAGQLR